MERIDHKLLLSKIQDAERKYKSVAKAPPDVVAEIQALTDVDDPRERQVNLTIYELNIMQRYISGEISLTNTTRLLERSNSWVRSRVLEVKNGNYLVLEDDVDDEATKTH